MSKLKVRRPSPAMVVSLIAVFIALGGSAFAALGRDTVGTKQLKPQSVKTQTIAPKNVKGKNLAKRAVGMNKIKLGAVGGDRLANPSYWAYVSGGATPSVNRSNGATGVANVGLGHFKVNFATSIGNCSFQATPRHQTGGREIAAEIDPNDPFAVRVKVRDSGGGLVNGGSAFSVGVYC